MIRYLTKALLAHLRSGRSLFLLTLCGVALGVASVLSIQIVNRSALGAFEGSMLAVSGESDLTVVGRLPTFDDELFPEVLAVAGVERAWPIFRVDVAVSGRDEFYLEVVGVDLFGGVRVPWDTPPQERSSPIDSEAWTAISPEAAAALGMIPGRRFSVSSGSRIVELEVGALVDFRRLTPLAGTRLAVMDISRAQALFGGGRGLHQIEVRAGDGVDVERLQTRLAQALGPAVQVMTPQQRMNEAKGLMSAFRLNLTALSLVSLFVGAFVVYSSTQASLVRRRAEFGLLRSIGASRTQVLWLILAEVALLGVLGVAIGLPLGYLAASANVQMVSQTLSNLYLLEEIENLQLPVWIYGLAVVVGMGSALCGAIFPALEMSRKDTRELLAAYTLHERANRSALPLFAAGWLVIAVGWVVYLIFLREFRPGGFVAGFGLLIGIPLMAPWIVRLATRRLGLRGFGFLYGVKALGLRLQHTAFAVAALTVAVSMLIGITLMIGSFRRTVDLWLESSLRADVYITAESWQRARGSATMDPELVRELSTHPGVERVDTLRQFFAYSRDRKIGLGASDFGLPVLGRLTLQTGDLDEATRRVHKEGAALISEPLARKFDLGIDDTLIVDGPAGPIRFPIAGIFFDYSSENGSAAIDLQTMERSFGPGPINNIALYLREGLDSRQVVDRLKARFADRPLIIRSNRDLRREVFDIFDQTFAVTRLLQVMSLIIAACGITLTLIVMARERVSEMALYRALGSTRRQIFRVFVGKGLGIATLALALGSIGGLALSMILIFVINRAYFGWTIAVHWPWGELTQQVVTILIASLAASIYPALRASRTPATELTRENL